MLVLALSSSAVVAWWPAGPSSAGQTGAGAQATLDAAPVTPSLEVCRNASLLTGPQSPPPGAVTIAPGDNSTSFASYQLAKDTTYWLAPGVHTLGSGHYGQVQPDDGDTFVGAPGAVLDGQGVNQSAFDDQATGVTVEYLTIQGFVAPQGQMVVNHTGGRNWTIEHDTVTKNGGAGVGLASGSVVEHDCLAGNTEYGFSSFGGARDVTLSHDEISGNDATGAYDRAGKGSVQCGCSGGGKFWETVDATVTYDYVHDNGNVGIWVDTDNAGFDISHDYIADNYSEGIIYEISYNARISDNTVVGNALRAGPTLGGFPDSAIYISESGGDRRVASRFSGHLDVTGNVLTDNWGGVVLWENANRFCSDGSDHACTLVDPRTYSMTSCAAHLPSASAGARPDYFDGCRWKTMNVTVSHNVFSYAPASVGPACTAAAYCGYNGLFSEYGSSPPYKGWVVPHDISDRQHDRFVDNTYRGPWHFVGFAQGTRLSWKQWTSGVAKVAGSGDPFEAQDAGSNESP